MGRGMRLALLLLGAAAAAAGLGAVAAASSPCEKACNPRMGNLAHGRALRTDTSCGRGAAERFCAYSEDAQRRCRRPSCGRCSEAQAGLAHPPAAMADSPFRLPRSWWQAAQDATRETIRLDLEATFYFTHLIMVFKSPRPAAMVLERSQDFGETWKPYKYFAANCSATFGLEDDVRQRGAICTSRYSSPFPCTGGECCHFMNHLLLPSWLRPGSQLEVGAWHLWPGAGTQGTGTCTAAAGPCPKPL